MGMFVWDEKYTVNIAEIDRQHQKLFALFHELYDAMQEGQGHKVIDQVLDRMVDYTAYHFDFEEKLFQQYGYAEQAAHRAEHRRLAEQAKALALRLRSGRGEVEVPMATLKFLCDWLERHIMGSDKKFAPVLIAQGAR